MYILGEINMENYSEFLSNAVFDAISEIDSQFTHRRLIQIGFFGKHGIDYSFRNLIAVKKLLERNGVVYSVQDLANRIIDKLREKNVITNMDFDIFYDRDVINFNIKRNLLNNTIPSILKMDNIIKKLENNQNILVDFSSPNIAKDMHVGHLRSTIIGESICRFFEEHGYNVERINHIGDFGTQFGMLIEYLLRNNPNFENDIENMCIEDLQNFYKESKKLFDTDEDFKQAAYRKVVLLQNGDPGVNNAWEFIKEISRRSYNDIYKRLNINLKEVGESYYQNMIPKVISELEEKNLLTNENSQEDGRTVLKTNINKVPLIVKKSDGGYTYDTTDLAAIKHRLMDLKMDKIYYVIDVGQELHMKLIFEAAKMAGWLTQENDAKHIGFGLVLGDDNKKLKSRQGDTIKLESLLDEALVEAQKVIDNKNPNLTDEEKEKVVKCVAYGAVKYADLSTSRTNNYKFSFERMLSLKGNTAPYLLYAYTRICSIKRNLNGTKFEKEFLDVLEKADSITIENEDEEKLCKFILLLPEILAKIEKDLYFHILCSYLYELSNVFHNFFMKCRCLHYDKEGNLIEIDTNRLVICEVTRRIMEKCFYILNIETVEKM